MSCIELLSPAEATPDNPHWHKLRREGISASEIAAVLGISPWDSPFSLYWQKVNGWDTDDNEEMATGRRVEPVVADWWADTIGAGLEAYVRPAGLYASEARKWQLATPDRLVRRFIRPGVGQLVSVLECKWTGSWDGWGEPGSDDIPVYYRAQVLQQCDVLGVDEWHLAALGPGGFRAYTGHRDDADLTVMREAGRRFVDRLAAGDAPDVDGHTATLATVKRLHPDIEDRDEQISAAVADGYRRARALKARVTAAADRWEARLRAEMAAARRGVDADGRLVASRSIYDRAGYEVGPARIDRLNPGRSKK
ncbi:lambda-exonuclease family protein [Micromonospora aurantiaca]|uniref:lambda-exonuclease family protein n=1 Tax=Micromonospora aurantiaca (nom. illeg.) TaxID=47850 RepID=UPI00343241D8